MTDSTNPPADMAARAFDVTIPDHVHDGIQWIETTDVLPANARPAR